MMTPRKLVDLHRTLFGSIKRARRGELTIATEITRQAVERCQLARLAIEMNEGKAVDLSVALTHRAAVHRAHLDALFGDLLSLPPDRFLVAMDAVLLLLIFDSPARHEKGNTPS